MNVNQLTSVNFKWFFGKARRVHKLAGVFDILKWGERVFNVI